MRYDVVEQGDERGAARGRAVRDHRAGVAARLEVEQHSPVRGQGMPAHEGLGAEQEGLLRVGEDEHDVVARTGTLGEGPRGLQQRGHTGSVVRRTRGQGLRVVVGGQEDAARGIGAGQNRHHVVHRSGGEVLPVGTGRPHGLLALQLQAQSGQHRLQRGADLRRGGAADGPGLPRDPLEVDLGPRGAELFRRRARGRRSRGPHTQRAAHRGRDQEGEETGERTGPGLKLHGSFSAPSRPPHQDERRPGRIVTGPPGLSRGPAASRCARPSPGSSRRAAPGRSRSPRRTPGAAAPHRPGRRRRRC